MIGILPRRQSPPNLNPRLFSRQLQFIVVATQTTMNVLQSLVHLQKLSGLDQLYILVILTGAPKMYQQLRSGFRSHTDQEVLLPRTSLEHHLPYHGTVSINLHNTIGHLSQFQHIQHLMNQV